MIKRYRMETLGVHRPNISTSDNLSIHSSDGKLVSGIWGLGPSAPDSPECDFPNPIKTPHLVDGSDENRLVENIALAKNSTTRTSLRNRERVMVTVVEGLNVSSTLETPHFREQPNDFLASVRSPAVRQQNFRRECQGLYKNQIWTWSRSNDAVGIG